MAAVYAVEVESPPVKDDVAVPSSKKRKSQVEEIEVDLSLPEPPSKKAKRLLKKGKPLPVKLASDDEPEDGGVPPSKASTKEGKKENKRSEHGIWIGNLPFYMTRVELFRWFVENSGDAIKEENITRVNLPMVKAKAAGRSSTIAGEDQSNKPQSRGFAYVDFDSETAAVAAMALTETELSGRKVLIKNAKSFEGRPQPQAQQQENGAGAALGDGRGESGAGAANGAKDSPTRTKIYVGNLSFQTTEDDLRAHFERCGEIEWVKVATFEDSGKCKGYGWVRFKDPEAAGWAVKGFVKIKEEIETEDDFRDSRDGAGESADDANEKKEKEKERKFKMRKWFVNKLHGREIKIDYAEDDKVRYKKRFGKDAPERKPRHNNRGPPVAGAGQKENDTQPSRPAHTEKKKEAYGDAGVASYLTGSVVKPQGKKITFD